MLSAGDPAPDFDCQGVHDGEIGTYRLSKFAERGVAILAFYPFDFAPTCESHLRGLAETDWRAYDGPVAVLGISPDGPFAHEEFARRTGIHFPLLSDASGFVADTYGVLAERVEGFARVTTPANVLVDTDMTIRYVDRREDPFAVPDRDALLDALESVPG